MMGKSKGKGGRKGGRRGGSRRGGFKLSKTGHNPMYKAKKKK